MPAAPSSFLFYVLFVPSILLSGFFLICTGFVTLPAQYRVNPLMTAALISVVCWLYAYSQWNTNMVWSMAALAIAPISFIIAAYGGEYWHSYDIKKNNAKALTEIRAELAQGNGARSCELMNRDPMATAEEMGFCQKWIESQPNDEARFKEFEKFYYDFVYKQRLNPSLNDWNVQQVGLSKTWEWNAKDIPPVPVGYQIWFVEKLTAVFLSRIEKLPQEENGLNKLQGFVFHVMQQEWAEGAQKIMRDKSIPDFLAALEQIPAVQNERTKLEIENVKNSIKSFQKP